MVLPDFTRLYQIDTSDEEGFLSKPWWWMRHHILALYSIPDSVTALRFTRERTKDS